MLVDFQNFRETVISCKGENPNLPCIYYLGITAHSNLGDTRAEKSTKNFNGGGSCAHKNNIGMYGMQKP